MRARPKENEEPLRTSPLDLSSPPTIEELLTEQELDVFYQPGLSCQSTTQEAAFFEDVDGLLKRKPKLLSKKRQIVVLESLRPRVLMLARSSQLASHPGLNRMYYTLSEAYCRPQMAADVVATAGTVTDVGALG